MLGRESIALAVITVALATSVSIGASPNAGAAPCAGRYDVDAANGIVTDNDTKLVWQRVADATPRTYTLSLFYCENLTLGGFTDWRLPTVFELQTIVDESVHAPSIDTAAFDGGGVNQNGVYWTMTKTPQDTSKQFVVDFGINFAGGSLWFANPAGDLNRVRCVR